MTNSPQLTFIAALEEHGASHAAEESATLKGRIPGRTGIRIPRQSAALKGRGLIRAVKAAIRAGALAPQARSRNTCCLWRRATNPPHYRSRIARIPAIALLVPALVAQTPPPSVHDLAQRIDAHYNQLHSLRATFTETYTGLGVDRTESGTLLLAKPGRMKWDYSSPPGKLFLLDGKYAWFYSPGDPQIERMPAAKLDDLRSPLRFLLGHTQLEKELTNIKLSPAPDGQFTLIGQAKGQEQRVRRVVITATAAGSITAMEVDEIDGAITRFTFGSQQPNAAIPATAFHFTPPAGVHVVDAPPPV